MVAKKHLPHWRKSILLWRRTCRINGGYPATLNGQTGHRCRIGRKCRNPDVGRFGRFSLISSSTASLVRGCAGAGFAIFRLTFEGEEVEEKEVEEDVRTTNLSGAALAAVSSSGSSFTAIVAVVAAAASALITGGHRPRLSEFSLWRRRASGSSPWKPHS